MSKIKAIHTLKESIIEQKFIAGESEDHITEWSQQIEGSLKVADEEALSVRNLIAKIEKKIEQKQKWNPINKKWLFTLLLLNRPKPADRKTRHYS